MTLSTTVRGTFIGFLIGTALSAYSYIFAFLLSDISKKTVVFDDSLAIRSLNYALTESPQHQVAIIFTIVTLILWASAGTFIGFIIELPTKILDLLFAILFGALFGAATSYQSYIDLLYNFTGLIGGGLLGLWLVVLTAH